MQALRTRLVLAVIAALVIGIAYGFASAHRGWFPAPQLTAAWYDWLRWSRAAPDGLVGDGSVPATAQADAAVPAGTDLVMLGDSLTLMGRWAERFSDLKTANRGIGGDGAGGVLDRLGPIVAAQPRQVFLMIGINDLRAGNHPRDILAAYDRIAAKMPEETELVVQSLLPCAAPACSDGDNRQLARFNAMLARWARRSGVRFVNLHPLFLRDGLPNEDLLTDGVHLNATGYGVWQDAITPFIDAANSPATVSSAS